MFLFTTPNAPTSTPPPASGGSTIEAIRKGADATGTDFDYLLRTAKRESALDPTAKAPTSSATGLFQFIEQTWLGVLKRDGDKLGLSAEASAVSARPDGTYTVTDPSLRQTILKLREQPEVASLLAGTLTRQNADALGAAIGRQPSAGELYIAHVLGARGATDLITTATRDPNRVAAADFPDAARANRGIFYDRSGRPRSASEVYSVLAAAQAEGTSAGVAKPSTTSPAPPAVTVTGWQPAGLGGLFQTGARPGPVSDAVARIWRTNNGGGAAARSDNVRPYYPRSGEAIVVEHDRLAPEPPDRDPASVPAAAPAAAPAVAPDARYRFEPSPAGPGASTTLPLTAPLPPARPTGRPPAGRTALRLDQKAAQP